MSVIDFTQKDSHHKSHVAHHSFSRYIGERIKKLRKIHHISGKNLAVYLNISQQQLSRYENGNGNISFIKIYLIAIYFNVDLKFFMKWITLQLNCHDNHFNINKRG